MVTRIRKTILVLGDIALAFLSLLLTVYFGFWGNFSWQTFHQHLLPFTILYIVWFAIFYIFGLYDLHSLTPKLELLIKIGECFLVCFIIGLAFFYLIPLFGITPKTNLLINVLLLALLMLLWRKTFYALFSSWYLQNIAFLGRSNIADKLTETIKSNPQLGYKFIGFLATNKPLAWQMKKTNTAVLVINQDISQNQKTVQELYKCLPLRVEIIDLAKAYEIILHKVPIDFVNQAWFLANIAEGEKRTYDKLKRISDFLLSAIILLLTSPLWAFIALAIKLDDNGPIFYKQKRVGRDGREFLIWKFRSMKVDAEKDGAKWADKNDRRVTIAGKVLRNLHFDEFPQMLNVLKGDLSLIGPRPERPEFVRQLETEIPHYHLRHLIKPGFTGWAQVSFKKYARNTLESHEKFQYDLYYIKNRSFFLDLGILLKTFQLFFQKG